MTEADFRAALAHLPELEVDQTQRWLRVSFKRPDWQVHTISISGGLNLARNTLVSSIVGG